MANNRYDAIVVGARCAGSPTAMLLARKGYKVLVVDRATFPSDTISTHIVHPPGVAALQRWGLLDRLTATGCPPIDTYAFDFGPFTISGRPRNRRVPVAYCPRRTRARQAARGRRVRGGSRGPRGVHRRRGRHRGRARHRRPRPRQGRHDRHRAGPGGHRRRRAALARRPGRGARAVQREAAAAVRLLHLLERAADGRPLRGLHPPGPGFAACAHPRRPDAGRRRLAVRGVRGQQGRRRRQLPQDVRPGAGLRRADPRRQARSALRRHGGAELLPQALSARAGRWSATPATTRTSSPPRASPTPSATPSCAPPRWTRRSPVPAPSTPRWATTRSTRDEHVLPMYEFTCQLATLEPPPPELQQLLAAMHGNQEAMDGFARVNAGVTSPAEFFSEENVGRVTSQARATTHP